MDHNALKARMRTPLIVDLRNIMDERELRLGGFDYRGIGGAERHAYVDTRVNGSGRFTVAPTRRRRHENIMAAE